MEERTIDAETVTGGGGNSYVSAASNNDSNIDSLSYVTYGMLQKNHEFVDWVRVDLEDDDKIRVRNASNGNLCGGESSSEPAAVVATETTAIDTFEDMDERAFELFKTQWQEISSCGPNDSDDGNHKSTSASGEKNDNNNSSSVMQDSIALGKKFLTSTKTPSPDSVSYGIFDEHWNVVKLSPRHSNVDMAVLLHAASEAGKENINKNNRDNESISNNNDSNSIKKDQMHEKRTYLKDPLLGKEQRLPIVPIRRSSQQQFLTKKSVEVLFRKESIEFFACFPLRYSPRTIYRFDMVGGGIDRNFWHQRKANRSQQRRDMNPHQNPASKQRESFWNNLTRKPSIGSWGKSSSGTANENSSNIFGEMQSKMASNAASMRNSFAARVSTTKESFLNLSNNNKIKRNEQKELNDEEDFGNNTSNTETTMPDKLSQIKQRMSENTISIRNRFASKISATKLPILKREKETHSDRNSKKIADDHATTNDTTSTGLEDFVFAIDEIDKEDDTLDSPNKSKSTPSGYFAFTIDDAPCRFDDRSHSHLESVLDLLNKYDAKATFMVISSFLTDCHRSDMIRLLKEGHELANHGVRDEPMHKTAISVEAFLRDLDECNDRITELQTNAGIASIGVRWFRAPQGRYTAIMEEGLVRRNMYNVMCDAYAACPIVEDAPWIASALGKQIRNGSIAILHMPERCGFREYCLEAMERLLEDLCIRRNFKAVTVGELERLSREMRAGESGDRDSDHDKH